jgi:hypothetical protein
MSPSPQNAVLGCAPLYIISGNLAVQRDLGDLQDNVSNSRPLLASRPQWCRVPWRQCNPRGPTRVPLVGLATPGARLIRRTLRRSDGERLRCWRGCRPGMHPACRSALPQRPPGVSPCAGRPRLWNHFLKGPSAATAIPLALLRRLPERRGGSRNGLSVRAPTRAATGTMYKIPHRRRLGDVTAPLFLRARSAQMCCPIAF